MDRKSGANFVSEWYGHRVYPTVFSSPQSLADQKSRRCPFLSDIKGQVQECIKKVASRGVCTISSNSNGLRQDWLVCPYRAFDPAMIENAVRRLYNWAKPKRVLIISVTKLAHQETRDHIVQWFSRGARVFVYFDAKLGGEISLSATPKSPEFSFDVFILEIERNSSGFFLGSFGVLEVQTMDFYGTYSKAVRNLTDALRLHAETFSATLSEHPDWMSQDVEGPNIANVFKRTFYQMAFKFQIGLHERCVGCVLAIPQSVWDSWQRHLGGPEMKQDKNGTYYLWKPSYEPIPRKILAWIYVFDVDTASNITPNSVIVKKVIGTDAPSFSYFALKVAPEATIMNVDSVGGLLTGVQRRLSRYWPELVREIEKAKR